MLFCFAMGLVCTFACLLVYFVVVVVVVVVVRGGGELSYKHFFQRL